MNDPEAVITTQFSEHLIIRSFYSECGISEEYLKRKSNNNVKNFGIYLGNSSMKRRFPYLMGYPVFS